MNGLVASMYGSADKQMMTSINFAYLTDVDNMIIK